MNANKRESSENISVHSRPTCPSCSAGIKKNVTWELVGNLLLCLPAIAAVLAFYRHVISLGIVLFVIVLTIAAGTVLFPYVTKLDLSAFGRIPCVLPLAGPKSRMPWRRFLINGLYRISGSTSCRRSGVLRGCR